jgi:hypothetical protein
MKKQSASHEETWARVLQTVTSRRRVSAEVNQLFGEAAKMQKADSQLMKKMFTQAPAVVTTAPNLQKMASVAPTVEAFFEKMASESLTRPVPNMKRPPAPTAFNGATAARASLTGGAA